MPIENPDVLRLAQSLVQSDSVTTAPNLHSAELTAEYLENLGFHVKLVPYRDFHGTEKSMVEAVRYSGSAQERPGVGYFCHTDVVPVDGWNCSQGGPFEARVAEERMWGRGSCDMKGSIAAALDACRQITAADQTGPIYFFATGDEECGMAGAKKLSEESSLFREMVQSQAPAIIGEPTSLQLVHAHKGVCHLEIIAQGVAAHSSTADGKNANWKLIPFLSWLTNLEKQLQTEDRYQNDAFSPSSMTMNLVVENQPHASNITVGLAKAHIFLRPMNGTDWQQVTALVADKARSLELEVKEYLPLPPVETPADSPPVRETLQLLGQTTPLAVCYATDGCFLQELNTLLVLGPGSIEQAHRPDEFIDLEQLHSGTKVFEQVFRFHAGRS